MIHYQRRNFIKKTGIGAVLCSMARIGSFVKSENFQKQIETLNGFEIEFLSKGNVFQGIGKISKNGADLRSGRLPMFANITTPEATEMVNYTLMEKVFSGTTLTLLFRMFKKQNDLMEWMLHTVRNRRNITDWTKEPEEANETFLKLIISPVERMLGRVPVSGFSYQYEYYSKEHPVYKLTDRGTWEIGGKACGNEFWMRNGVVESVRAFKTRDEFYSTEWYLPGISNPNIFQFHPLQTHLQGFTFTLAQQGILITYPNKVAHIRSLFEKWRNYDEIVHIHEHCSDLAEKLITAPVEVLWLPGSFNKIEAANIYYAMKEIVHDELHNQTGMKREEISTYGIIAEWTEPDFEYYTREGLPKLMEAGVKKVFIPNQCENDMNTWGVSNMCCNVDYKISENTGEEKLKAFCRKAKESGMKVEMWGNTAISTLTERFMHRDGKQKRINFLSSENSIAEVIRNAKEPFVLNLSNAIEADHYTPRFCVLNLRDETILSYWLKQWRYFHDEIGLEGIFLDSSFNLSSDKFHHMQWIGSVKSEGAAEENRINHRPLREISKSIQSQYFAHLKLVVEMQKMGYSYCGEDLGVFGINRTGPDILERVKNLHLWENSYCDFDADRLIKCGYEPMRVFFKGLAFKMIWKVYWNIKENRLEIGTDNPLAIKLLKIFNTVSEFMVNREILEQEKGVLYRKGNVTILWAFENFDLHIHNVKTITRLSDGKEIYYPKKDTVSAKGLQVYKILHI